MGKVLKIVVVVVCEFCHGKKCFPGGKYKDQGEVVNCPVCNGYGTQGAQITLAELKKLLDNTKDGDEEASSIEANKDGE